MDREWQKVRRCGGGVLTSSPDVDQQVALDHGAAQKALGRVHRVDDGGRARLVAEAMTRAAEHAGGGERWGEGVGGGVMSEVEGWIGARAFLSLMQSHVPALWTT